MALGFRVVGLGASVAAGLVAARLLGPEQFGTLSLFLVCGMVFGGLAVDGLDTLLIRGHAGSGSRSWPSSGVGGAAAALPSLAAAAAAALVAVLFFASSDVPALVALVLGISVLRRQQAALSVERPLAAQLGEFVVLPFAYAIAVVSTQPEGYTGAGWCFLASVASAVGVQSVLLSRSGQGQGPNRRDETLSAPRGSLRVVGAAVLLQGLVPIALLGWLAPRAEVGVFGVTSRLGGLVALPLGVITLMVAPRFAAMQARGDVVGLQRAFTSATRSALLGALGVSAAVVILSPSLTGLLGARFPDVRLPLLVIVVGQVLNAGVGPVATALKVTGYERDVGKAVLIGLGCNVALSLALVGHFGAVGAASAASLSTITWNALLLQRIRRRLLIGGGPLTQEAT